MKRGRSLRAALAIVLTWVAVRTAVLLHMPGGERDRLASRTVATATEAATASPRGKASVELRTAAANEQRAMPAARTGRQSGTTTLLAKDPPLPVLPIALTVAADIVAGQPSVDAGPPSVLPQAQQHNSLATAVQTTAAWLDPSISAWAIIRPSGSGQALASNGQLGASQAGVRIQQVVRGRTSRAAVALNLRLSSPLDQSIGKEAGAGLALRFSARLPAELIVERRIAIDRGGRNALAIVASGGVDDRLIPLRLRLSAYIQGGVVGAAQHDGFIDGAARIEHPLDGARLGDVRIGAGLWGGAQPGVNRLDAGPLVSVKQRMGGTAIRLSAEYRWRVAGRARPGSGPALSIGTSF